MEFLVKASSVDFFIDAPICNSYCGKFYRLLCQYGISYHGDLFKFIVENIFKQWRCLLLSRKNKYIQNILIFIIDNTNSRCKYVKLKKNVPVYRNWRAYQGKESRFCSRELYSICFVPEPKCLLLGLWYPRGQRVPTHC